MSISSEFQEFSKELVNVIQPLKTNQFPIVFTHSIDCNLLPNHELSNGCFEHSYLKPFFDRLKTLKHPVLYWFEISSEQTGQQVFNLMKSYRDLAGRKNFPALKKKINPKTKIVYVGKSKKRTDGRMFVHLGYYKVPGTAGLQLAHWAIGTGIVLNVNFIELPVSKETENLLSLFEQKLASLLQPLAGKHNL